MPSRILLGALIGTLAVTWAAWGQGSGPAKPAAVAGEKWVQQLGDPDYRMRDEATDNLARLGEAALPALRAAKQNSDPEVRRRAQELVTVLETATVMSPKTVSLRVQGKSAKGAAEELARQTGYKVECWNAPEDRKLDFDWKGVPFWTAVEDLCRQGGLVVQPSYGDDRLRLMYQDRFAPYVCFDGAFRIVAGGFQHNRHVDFATISRGRPEPQRQDQLTFSFTIYSEPRLPLLGIADVKLTAAYDNENNSMVPSAGGESEGGPAGPGQRVTRYYGGGQRQCSYPADVPLVRPSPRATTARQIRGTADLVVLVDQKPEVVTDSLSTAKGKKV